MKNENYIKIKAIKKGMSQTFGDDSKVIPFTSLKLCDEQDVKHFESFEAKSAVTVIGMSKGKGYQGVMKLWNFSGGPGSHGQKNKHRAPGSIGTQGQGRVMPGKKMAGRMGGEKKTIVTKFLSLDKDSRTVQVKGCIPGAKNSPVKICLIPNVSNES